MTSIFLHSLAKLRFHRSVVFLVLPLLTLALFSAGCNSSESGQPAAQVAKQKYHCPMHPTYVSDRPGDCPICNMSLVPIKDGAGGGDHGAHAVPETSKVPGRIAIALSPEKRQMIGLRLAEVQQRDLSTTIRTTAIIEHDETSLARIAPRFSGWVRDLKVNFTGQEVEKGQPLLTVYSPELVSAQNEYLLAYQRLSQLKKESGNPQYDAAQRLAESARRRLALWEISDQEIRVLEESGQPMDELLIRSPVSGHVVSKTAVAGKAFMAGETLYEIADLMNVWLRASVYEYELPLIKVGQKARVILPYLGNKTYRSEVTFIYPHIDPQTRRAEIRLALENPKHELRPGMWANVVLHASIGSVLAIPASAVIDTGARFVAFVQREDNHLEPREVEVGAKTDDYYQVLGGLEEDEKVVDGALFLVDSESQLKAAIAGMSTVEEHQH